MNNPTLTVSVLFYVFIRDMLPAIEARVASVKLSLDLNISEDQQLINQDMVHLCALKTDLSMEELRKFSENDFNNTTKTTQCFTHCLYEHMSLVRDGVFVERDNVSSLDDAVIDPKHISERECFNQCDENKCERDFLIHQCYYGVEERGIILSEQQFKNTEDNLNEEKEDEAEAASDVSLPRAVVESMMSVKIGTERQIILKKMLAKRQPKKQDNKHDFEEEK